MSRHLALGLKLSAITLLGLFLVMALLRMLWPDIGWGFLLLFGLQVMLMLATLQLMVTSIWGPASHWALPGKTTQLPRRIFAKKSSIVATLRAVVQRVVGLAQAPFRRLFRRKAL